MWELYRYDNDDSYRTTKSSKKLKVSIGATEMRCRQFYAPSPFAYQIIIKRWWCVCVINEDINKIFKLPLPAVSFCVFFLNKKQLQSLTINNFFSKMDWIVLLTPDWWKRMPCRRISWFRRTWIIPSHKPDAFVWTWKWCPGSNGFDFIKTEPRRRDDAIRSTDSLIVPSPPFHSFLHQPTLSLRISLLNYWLLYFFFFVKFFDGWLIGIQEADVLKSRRSDVEYNLHSIIFLCTHTDYPTENFFDCSPVRRSDLVWRGRRSSLRRNGASPLHRQPLIRIPAEITINLWLSFPPWFFFFIK